MLSKMTKFARQIILATNQESITATLVSIYIISLFGGRILEQITSLILLNLVFGIWAIYKIALQNIGNSYLKINNKLTIASIIFVFLYSFFLFYFFNLGEKFPVWMFILVFLGNIYVLINIGLMLKSIGRNLISLEKKTAVKLEEYVGLSLALLLYIFAIPLLHSRIQRAILAINKNESDNSNQLINQSPKTILSWKK